MKLSRVNSHGGGLYGYSFHCPGCDDSHIIPTTGVNAWQFNDDLERPTLSPSILVHEVKKTDGSVFSPRCHSVVRDGRIEYLSDCGHSFAGQTVDLPEAQD